jgi:hypothetical protein
MPAAPAADGSGGSLPAAELFILHERQHEKRLQHQLNHARTQRRSAMLDLRRCEGQLEAIQRAARGVATVEDVEAKERELQEARAELTLAREEEANAEQGIWAPVPLPPRRVATLPQRFAEVAGEASLEEVMAELVHRGSVKPASVVRLLERRIAQCVFQSPLFVVCVRPNGVGLSRLSV